MKRSTALFQPCRVIGRKKTKYSLKTFFAETQECNIIEFRVLRMSSKDCLFIIYFAFPVFVHFSCYAYRHAFFSLQRNLYLWTISLLLLMVFFPCAVATAFSVCTGVPLCQAIDRLFLVQPEHPWWWNNGACISYLQIFPFPNAL